MARKTLTLNQQAAVDQVTAFNLAWRQAKLTIQARIRDAIEAELKQMSDKQDQLIRDAVTLGVPLAEFRRPESGLHTSNPHAVLDSLKRTEAVAEVVTEVMKPVESDRYRVDNGRLVVSLPSAVLDDLVRQLDIEPDVTVPLHATFTVTEADRLDSVTGIKIPGTIERDPTVFWAYRPENEADAVAWWKANS